MGQITVIGPTTDAIGYTQSGTYQNDGGTATYNPPQPVNTAGYRGISVSADALATTEEVDIYVSAGGAVKVLTNASGTVQKLTASIPALYLEGGPTYLFSKDVTASDCGVYVDFQLR